MTPQTFRTSPSTTVLYFVFLAGLVALIWWLMDQGKVVPWFGWLGSIFFGILAILCPVFAILGKPSLKLYDEGFTLRLFFEQHRYKWNNVRAVRLKEIRLHTSSQTIVVVEVDKKCSHQESPDHTFDLSIATGLFQVRPGDLANMMNVWRDAALLQNDFTNPVRSNLR